MSGARGYRGLGALDARQDRWRGARHCPRSVPLVQGAQGEARLGTKIPHLTFRGPALRAVAVRSTVNEPEEPTYGRCDKLGERSLPVSLKRAQRSRQASNDGVKISHFEVKLDHGPVPVIARWCDDSCGSPPKVSKKPTSYPGWNQPAVQLLSPKVAIN
jgi:hypothetical protein